MSTKVAWQVNEEENRKKNCTTWLITTCKCQPAIGCMRWTIFLNTNVSNGLLNPASTLTVCQAACVRHLQCTDSTGMLPLREVNSVRWVDLGLVQVITEAHPATFTLTWTETVQVIMMLLIYNFNYSFFIQNLFRFCKIEKHVVILSRELCRRVVSVRLAVRHIGVLCHNSKQIIIFSKCFHHSSFPHQTVCWHPQDRAIGTMELRH